MHLFFGPTSLYVDLIFLSLNSVCNTGRKTSPEVFVLVEGFLMLKQDSDKHIFFFSYQKLVLEANTRLREFEQPSQLCILPFFMQIRTASSQFILGDICKEDFVTL